MGDLDQNLIVSLGRPRKRHSKDSLAIQNMKLLGLMLGSGQDFKDRSLEIFLHLYQISANPGNRAAVE